MRINDKRLDRLEDYLGMKDRPRNYMVEIFNGIITLIGDPCRIITEKELQDITDDKTRGQLVIVTEG